MVHLHGLYLSGQLVGGESNDHTGLDDSSLDTAHRDCSNASNFVNILEYTIVSTIIEKNKVHER